MDTIGGSISGYSRSVNRSSANSPKAINNSEMTDAKTGLLMDTSDKIMAAGPYLLSKSLRVSEPVSSARIRTGSPGRTFCKPWVMTRCPRSEEHMSELQSRGHLVCRLLLEKKT